MATVLFLVDGKLVLLQPTTSEDGVLKYEMRIIAQNVEYYALMRDHPSFKLSDDDYLPPSPSLGLPHNSLQGHDLRDSLWYFDGQDMKLWIDAQDVLVSASVELGRDLPATVSIPVDFYPLSPLLNKGILFGVESELVQRRDIDFAYFRFATRVSLQTADQGVRADRSRLTSSSRRFCGIIFRSTTPLQRCICHTTINIWSTSPTRWRFFCTTCWMTKSIMHPLPSRRCYQACCPSCRLSHSTSTLWYSVRARRNYDLGGRCLRTCHRRKSCLRSRCSAARSRRQADTCWCCTRLKN